MKTTYTVEIQKPNDGFWHPWKITTDENLVKELSAFFQYIGIPYRVIRSVESGLPLVKDPSLN